MKKVFVVLLVTIMLFSMVIPAYAALPDPPISPQYDYIDSYKVVLNINQSSGVASCSANCYAPNANKVGIEYKLQRYMNSYWATVTTWNASGTSYASLSKSATVSSGYTYRGQATYRIYDSSGNLLETGSATKTYSYPTP